jgi:citrate lyase subunit beta/citryl-CoA lyase
MPEATITGNSGAKVRSDCQVSLKIQSSGGVVIELESKVKALYGKNIEGLLKDILSFYNINNARLIIKDSGALDPVIAARMEAAIKKQLNTSENFLLPMLEDNNYPSPRDRFRFSRLYLPGNTPSMMINAGIHNPDGIILDLEDSVAPEKKFEARFLIRNALRGINFYGAERMVRINQFPEALEDLEYVVPHNVHVILLPKCEGADQVLELLEEIKNIKNQHEVQSEIYLMPIIESAQGVEKAYEIASASDDIIALAIGLEDYTADIGALRTQSAQESFYARTRIVNACKATGKQAIDSVFSDVADEAGLRETIKESKSLGFEGMGCIHPRQIKVIHESFAPEPGEIEKAARIVNAFIEAERKGLGVVSLGSKMIDPPVVKRARRTISLARKLNIIDENWRNEYVS